MPQNSTWPRRRCGTRRSARVSAPTSILKSMRSSPSSLKIHLFIQLCIEMFGERLFIASRISSGTASLAKRSQFSPVRTLDRTAARSSLVFGRRSEVRCTSRFEGRLAESPAVKPLEVLRTRSDEILKAELEKAVGECQRSLLIQSLCLGT